MTTYEQGEFHDVDVTRSRNIQGKVTGRATVRADAHLLIQGHFDGVLDVEEGGMVTIQGSALGEVERNEGIILISGLTDWAFDQVPGRVVVSHGALLTGYGQDAVVLGADGSLAAVPSGRIEIDVSSAASYCCFEPEQERFIPMSELKEEN